MDFNYMKTNPSKFRIPPRDTCLFSNIYDIPCISPSYTTTKQCSNIVESFVDKNKNNNIVLKTNNYLWTFIEENTPNYIKFNI